jgi:hypothetical protein
MSLSRRLAPALLVLALSGLSIAACAQPPGAPDASDERFTEMAAFAAATSDDQLSAVTESARSLDVLTVDELRLDDVLGIDAADAAALLLRGGEAGATDPGLWDAEPEAEGARTSDSEGATIARASLEMRRLGDDSVALTGSAAPAFHDIGAVLAVVSETLFGTDGGQTGQGGSPEGTSPQYSHEFSHGSASGSVSDSATSTHDGVSVDHTFGSQFGADACPTSAGRASGAVSLVSSATATAPSGETTRTRIDVDLAFDIEVGDDAFADTLSVQADSVMLTGAPGRAHTVSQPTATTSAASSVSFSFGADGASSMSDYASSSTTSTSFDRSTEDLASKTALRLAAMLEDYWRSGACVEVTFEHPAEVPERSETDLGVQPKSRVDGEAIEGGVLAVESFSGAGRLTPAEGEHPNPTTFSWAAPSGAGAAEIAIRSVSKRGIGVDTTPIEVVRAWEVTGTKDGAVHYGKKCDGLEGAWTIEATGEFAFDYAARIDFVLDSSLVGPYTASMRVNGLSLGDSGEIWFEKVDDEHYILHSTTYDTTLDVRPAPAC